MYHRVSRMSNTSDTNIVKRGRGRPRKDATLNTAVNEETAERGIPAFLEPNVHDINDELARMDSYIYSQYNE